MLEHVIEYNGKNYPVKEPTIKTWTEVMKLKDILDDGELFIKVIELTTGLSQEEILAADASQVKKVGEKVLSIVTGSNKKVVTTFTHNGEDYEFLDVSNLTFGQFIDIDTFLGKDENYRTQNLAQLAAYLFIEKGSKYGDNNVAQRTKKFEELPIKYMEGAVFFFVEYSKSVRRTYTDLFQEQDAEVGDENKNTFSSYWGWYSAISALAENKVWLFRDVTSLPLAQALNHIAYLMDFNKEQEKKVKEQNRYG